MKQNDNDSSNKQPEQKGHSHMKHMWMMAACCGLPIVGLLAIGAIGISSPSLETLITLICPIGMGIMMYSMMRDKQGEDKGHACCKSAEEESKAQSSPMPDGDLTDKQIESLELQPVKSSESLKA